MQHVPGGWCALKVPCWVDRCLAWLWLFYRVSCVWCQPKEESSKRRLLPHAISSHLSLVSLHSDFFLNNIFPCSVFHCSSSWESLLSCTIFFSLFLLSFCCCSHSHLHIYSAHSTYSIWCFVLFLSVLYSQLSLRCWQLIPQYFFSSSSLSCSYIEHFNDPYILATCSAADYSCSCPHYLSIAFIEQLVGRATSRSPPPPSHPPAPSWHVMSCDLL